MLITRAKPFEVMMKASDASVDVDGQFDIFADEVEISFQTSYCDYGVDGFELNAVTVVIFGVDMTKYLADDVIESVAIYVENEIAASREETEIEEG